MSMGNFLKENLNKETKLVAPVTGKTIDLSKVPDEVFSGKLVGDGIAVEPYDDIISAPADGKLILVFNTLHAFAITLDNGLQVLVHIGVDTVALKGEGFEQLTETGAKVKAGTPIIKINRDFILNKGFSLITPVLITNMELVKELKADIDKDVIAGQDQIMTLSLSTCIAR
jgi:PTS system D-glucosamine-specific IIA component/PTS system glucose-specific IIA component